MSNDDTYRVDGVRNGREVSPFIDYVDQFDNVEFNCPSCSYSVLPEDLVQEGGTQCDGCGRTLRLHITADAEVPGWRNVPKEQQEAVR